MHEPGPPRTTSVGRPVELAPRDPDPAGRYEWTLLETPADSDAVVDDPIDGDGDGDEPGGDPEERDDPVLEPGETSRPDDPVVHLHPDAPGIYVLRLDAPDGSHRQRVRVFPDERRETTIRVSADEFPIDDDAVDRVSLLWRYNDRLLARDRPTREGDEWVYRTRVPPGRHGVGFVANDDRATERHVVHEVEGPGRPRLSLDWRVEGGGGNADGDRDGVGDDIGNPRLVVTADVGVPPDSETDPGDVEVIFLVDDRDADPETVERIEGRAEGRTLSVPLGELEAIGTAGEGSKAAGDESGKGDGGLRIHAVPHAERHGVAATLRLGRDAEGRPTATDPHARPAWAESPTVYEVYVRSFAGDTLPTTFEEIERRVEYLESLGIDALWLTPVLASPTEHGYHVTDYFETAADLGSRAAFESLVDACHDAGIRVIFDLVINHTSRDHPAFQLHSAGVPAYADRYRRADADVDVTGIDWAALPAGDVPEYRFDWEKIPNLNYDDPAVRAWMLSVVDEWAGVVDGFRADVAWGVPHGFWKEVADRVPDGFLLLDETLPHDPFYGEGEFDLHYDTSLYATLNAIGAGREPADALADALERARWLGFDDPSAQLRYVENHDEDRYLASHGEAALRAAAAVTFTLPGAPMVYAGQERGNETTRGPFRWHDGDNALTAHHRRLSALRDAEPALRSRAVDFAAGRAAVEVVDGDSDRVTAYERTADSTRTEGTADRLLVVVNFGSDPATVAVPDRVGRELFADEPVDGEVVVGSVAVLA
ncbi:alpha-amylase family glycosyl hydrolase [Halorubrum aethiopicum]|uniref:alpha-amylase family glycosyl hydrolase n=1 Tax=Halorubrum aethiopicum TaxID=1758255 RepID=UPI00083076D3|nr:alpha-amylase family glycosyl hydrolase [Halorubrum aethiopicum]